MFVNDLCHNEYQNKFFIKINSGKLLPSPEDYFNRKYRLFNELTWF